MLFNQFKVGRVIVMGDKSEAILLEIFANQIDVFSFYMYNITVLYEEWTTNAIVFTSTNLM